MYLSSTYSEEKGFLTVNEEIYRGTYALEEYLKN